MEKLKVIFHVNEPDRWEVALGNVTNLLRDVSPDMAEVRVLANGPSISAFADEAKLSTMQGLAEVGVKFLACRNSLNKLGCAGEVCITVDNLPPYIGVVPAGITELIKSQTEGFAYVKP
ncbi:MAG: DsrE family protein [Candidatus Magnetobacterium sp. LHC-1]|uniref:DsrE family protein n=1 Tax=Candidatus Magnetobacterium casense TaxID=1455061 RepID=A0ABS6RWG7_9BACT|nr:DsrE family protein [Candidatus Magnetobacterium casensis]MBF0606025.1 DsrE family protein [Nitrospirota bacterium]MBV6340931.1 DsrE family protein [Candidatus Magnetobacterium casensis]